MVDGNLAGCTRWQVVSKIYDTCLAPFIVHFAWQKCARAVMDGQLARSRFTCPAWPGRARLGIPFGTLMRRARGERPAWTNKAAFHLLNTLRVCCIF